NGKKRAIPTSHPDALVVTADIPPTRAAHTIAAKAAGNVSKFGMRRLRQSEMQASAATVNAMWIGCMPCNASRWIRWFPQRIHAGVPAAVNRIDRCADQADARDARESDRSGQQRVFDQILSALFCDQSSQR